MEERDIKVEIGDNLAGVMKYLLKTVNRENRRNDSATVLSPGDEFKKAFGLDISDICKHPVKGSRPSFVLKG